MRKIKLSALIGLIIVSSFISFVQPAQAALDVGDTSVSGEQIDFDEVALFMTYAQSVLLAKCRSAEGCPEANSSDFASRLAFGINLYLNGSYIIQEEVDWSEGSGVINVDTVPQNLPGTYQRFSVIESGSGRLASYKYATTCNRFADLSRIINFKPTLINEEVRAIGENFISCAYYYEPEPNNRPLDAARKLISNCKTDAEILSKIEGDDGKSGVCRETLYSLGGLITSPSQSSVDLNMLRAYYQTMYWNMHDNKTLSSDVGDKFASGDIEILSWRSLTASDIAIYKSVIANEQKKLIDGAPEKIDITVGRNTHCDISGGLGWYICDIAKQVTKYADLQFDLLRSSFESPVSLFKEDSTGKTPIKQVWTSFRDISNILIVIALIGVIFSQITGLGFSNYAIKKALPKIIVTAILISLSYYFVQIIIDLSNVLGVSIHDLFRSIANEAYDKGTATNVSWNSLLIIAGNKIVDVILIIVISVIGLLTWLSMQILLSIRLALIVLVVAMAPIGIASQLIPGLKRLGDTWWQALISAVLVYPMISLLYSFGYLTSLLALNPTSISSNLESKLLAIIPGILAPWLTVKMLSKVKMSSVTSAMGAITGFFGVKSLVNLYKSDTFSKRRKLRKQQYKEKEFANNYTGKNPFRRIRQNLTKNSPSLARAKTQVFEDRAKRLSEASELVSPQVAQALLQDLSAKSKNQFSSLTDNQKIEYTRVSKLNPTISDQALVATQSIFNAGEQAKTIDMEKVFAGLKIAKDSGANQLELASVVTKFRSKVLENKDPEALGEIDANLKHYGSYGEYNPDDYQITSPLQMARVENIKQNILNMLSGKVEKDKSRIGLNYHNIRPSSASRQAIKELLAESSTKDAMTEIIKISDPEVIKEANRL